MPSFHFKWIGNELNFRPVTRRELYKVIDKLPTQKSAWAVYIPSWALTDCKVSIVTHLQFAINECINANTIPDILKEAYLILIYKKGDRNNPENYRPNSVNPSFWKTSLEANFETIRYRIINENQKTNTKNVSQYNICPDREIKSLRWRKRYSLNHLFGFSESF